MRNHQSTSAAVAALGLLLACGRQPVAPDATPGGGSEPQRAETQLSVAEQITRAAEAFAVQVDRMALLAVDDAETAALIQDSRRSLWHLRSARLDRFEAMDAYADALRSSREAMVRFIGIVADAWDWSDAELIDGRRREIATLVESVEALLMIAVPERRDTLFEPPDLETAWLLGDRSHFQRRVRVWEDAVRSASVAAAGAAGPRFELPEVLSDDQIQLLSMAELRSRLVTLSKTLAEARRAGATPEQFDVLKCEREALLARLRDEAP